MHCPPFLSTSSIIDQQLFSLWWCILSHNDVCCYALCFLGLMCTIDLNSLPVHPALTPILIRLEIRQNLLQDLRKRATVKLFRHKQTLHTDMLQTSSLWRRMLRYMSMSHNKKPLIMHIDYREALRRRCCAWSRSMADGCAAACMRYAMLLMSPASSSLILNCVVMNRIASYYQFWIISTKAKF